MSFSSSGGSGCKYDTYSCDSLSKSKHKHGISNHHSMSHVGFAGLNLTPIQESPMMESMMQDDAQQHGGECQKWLPHGDDRDAREVTADTWHAKTITKGSLPQHWVTNGQLPDSEDVVAVTQQSKETSSSKASTTCCVNFRVVQATALLPKDEPMTTEEKRAHLYRLLLFALCGFVIVAGIVLWIFSPSFS